jgi:hypothetical protein
MNLRFQLFQPKSFNTTSRFLVQVINLNTRKPVWSDTAISTSLFVSVPIRITSYHAIDVSYMERIPDQSQSPPFRYYTLQVFSESAYGSTTVPFDHMMNLEIHEVSYGATRKLLLASSLQSESKRFGGFRMQFAPTSLQDGEITSYTAKDYLTLVVYSVAITAFIVHIVYLCISIANCSIRLFYLLLCSSKSLSELTNYSLSNLWEINKKFKDWKSRTFRDLPEYE